MNTTNDMHGTWALVCDHEVVDEFDTEEEALEATFTGEYPDNAEVAWISDPF